ncbi:unnamed protein product [Oikopleura dioica]|uniref:Uncharacterized protein n=1 Tax=Oikopleura dioica TaxID=34765 RepID=E4WQA2_OIKDI|nr:unnamed protein product [Oikopleura dioica]
MSTSDSDKNGCPTWNSFNDESLQLAPENPGRTAWLETVTTKIFAKTLHEAFLKIQENLTKLYHAAEILGISDLLDRGEAITLFKVCVTDWIVKAAKDDTSHLFIDSYLGCDAKFTDFRWFSELAVHKGIFTHLTSMRNANKARFILPSGIIAIEAIFGNDSERFHPDKEEARIAKFDITENIQATMLNAWIAKHINPKSDPDSALQLFLEPQDLDVKAVNRVIKAIKISQLKPRLEARSIEDSHYGLKAGPYSCSADSSGRMEVAGLSAFAPKATAVTAMADAPRSACTTGSYLDTTTANPAILSPLFLCNITEDRKIIELGHKAAVLYIKALESFFESKATLIALRLVNSQNLKECIPVTEQPSFMIPCGNMLAFQASAVPDFERKQFIRARKEILVLAEGAEKKKLQVKHMISSLTSTLNDATSWELALTKNYSLTKEIAEELRSDILCTAGLTVDEFFSKHLTSATWSKGTFHPYPSPQLQRMTTILSANHEKWACHDLLRLIIMEITGNIDIANNAINEIDSTAAERLQLKRSLNSSNNSTEMPNLSQILPARDTIAVTSNRAKKILLHPAKKQRLQDEKLVCSTPAQKQKPVAKNSYQRKSTASTAAATVLRNDTQCRALQDQQGSQNITIISDDYDLLAGSSTPVVMNGRNTLPDQSNLVIDDSIAMPNCNAQQNEAAMDTSPPIEAGNAPQVDKTGTKAYRCGSKLAKK